MTREEAKKLLPVIQAWAEGKEVQVKCRQGMAGLPWAAWRDLSETSPHFNLETHEWRIKPTPREWWLCNGCDGAKSNPGAAVSCCGYKDPIRVREVLDEGGAP